jgi:hypothetical protein
MGEVSLRSKPGEGVRPDVTVVWRETPLTTGLAGRRGFRR